MVQPNFGRPAAHTCPHTPLAALLKLSEVPSKPQQPGRTVLGGMSAAVVWRNAAGALYRTAAMRHNAVAMSLMQLISPA